MAAELEKKFGCTTKLIESRGGVFEVVGDGKLLFSKKKTGRFPEFDEIARQMK
ncbi:MAG: Rdx family protein [Chitinispirillaceae bacterium]|nr:Rdx family protein [Chitinispirillaceae bacterium]